jgi:hypothetical protein
MKRIAAVIATTTFALLAIPATAMASTSGTGPTPGQAFSMCKPPRGIQVVQVSGTGQVAVTPATIGKRPHHFRCSLPRRRPAPPTQVCTPGTVTFDMPPNVQFFTEYSGPELYVGEQFSYGGTTYNIATVSGAVFSLGGYVNGGQSVVDTSGTVSCTGISTGS